MDSENVRVFCRLKPLSDGEQPSCVLCCEDDEQSVSVKGRGLSFGFTRVLGPQATQEDVFNACGRAPCASVLDGFNGAVLAFGQTGSGKTHSIHGDELAPGLIPRVMGDLFDQIGRHASEDSPFSFEVRLSYVEVYNERIYDLLLRCAECGGLTDDPHCVAKSKLVFSCGHSLCAAYSLSAAARRGGAMEEGAHEWKCGACSTWQRRWRRSCAAGLSVSDLPKGGSGLWLSEAAEVPVSSIEEVSRVLRTGEEARQVAATGMNAQSSRSHAVLIASVTRRNAVSGKATTGQLYMADLAGSENLRRSGAGRLEETGHINRSLFTLGKVIDALLDGGRTHVPYRESKLTRLLQCALGGNARTSLLVTCSSELDDAAETLSTLRFGARAAQVVTQPTVNEFEMPSVLRARLAEAHTTIRDQQRSIDALTMQVAMLQHALGAAGLSLALPPVHGAAAANKTQPLLSLPPDEGARAAAMTPRDGGPPRAEPPPAAGESIGPLPATPFASMSADVLLLVLVKLDAQALCAVSATCHELWLLVSRSGSLWQPWFESVGGRKAWEDACREVESDASSRSLRQLFLDLKRRQAVPAGASAAGSEAPRAPQGAATRLGFRLVGSGAQSAHVRRRS